MTIPLRIQLHNALVENRRLKRRLRQLETRKGRKTLDYRTLRMGRLWLMWWVRT